MHEASIALSILETVCKQCERDGYSVIHSITLQIGKASGIYPDALTFAFDIAKQETVASEALLIIDHKLLGGQCRDCRRDFVVEDTIALHCPHCQGTSFTITQGFEMHVMEMDVD